MGETLGTNAVPRRPLVGVESCRYMGRKRKLGVAGALALAAAVTVAGVALGGPATQHGVTHAVELTFNPTSVPTNATRKVDPKGGAFGIGAEVSTADSSQPPATSKVEIALDEDLTVDTKGLPRCEYTEIIRLLADAARRQCKDALVTAEGPPVLPGSPSTNSAAAQVGTERLSSVINVFNGVPRGKKPVLLNHVDTVVPTGHVVFISTSTIAKGPQGSGTTFRIEIPPLGGGAVSTLRFEATLERTFKVRGEKHEFISAVCSDGVWNFNSTVTYMRDPATDPFNNPFGVSSLSPTDEVACEGKKKQI